MRYGHREFQYAEPIANGLVENDLFRRWVVQCSPFAEHAETSILLHHEQKATRTASAENWWRSYWVSKRYTHFAECGERETDLLAVFETKENFRFALHIEVKAPNDRFSLNQAMDYKRRAACWSGRERAPRTVVPHDAAATLLCCEQGFLQRHTAEVGQFDAAVTFEEIGDFLKVPS